MDPADCLAVELQIFSGLCPTLQSATMKARQKWMLAVDSRPFMIEFVIKLFDRKQSDFLGFVTDPSTDSETMILAQTYGTSIWPTVFHMARTWLYLHH